MWVLKRWRFACVVGRWDLERHEGEVGHFGGGDGEEDDEDEADGFEGEGVGEGGADFAA